MILRVTVANLYSFNEETEISFVAGKSTAHSEQLTRAEKRDDISVLKAGVIYGANASGKSNIIKAVSLIQDIALIGVPKRHVEPFKLVQNNTHPSKIELEFKLGKKYYAYGVEFTIRGVVEEWLFEINSRTDKKIYTREINSKGNIFSFGTITGDDIEENTQLLKYISQSTPTTDSFLAEYVKRNGKGLTAIDDVHNWFKEKLKIIFPKSRYSTISVRVEKDKEFANATKSLLEYFNTGIVDIRRRKIDKASVDLPKELVDEILADAKPDTNRLIASTDTTYFFETNSEGKTTIFKQNTIHHMKNKTEVLFNMGEESDGSIRLLDFIPMLIDLRLNDVVYLVDEIDRSMHPMLSYKLLECYFETLNDNRDTQLICSTHESNLLNLDLIRADEVWFVEKDKNGASHLTSLAEYKPREDVRKGYLQGRYGAIPFFAPIDNLKW